MYQLKLRRPATAICKITDASRSLGLFFWRIKIMKISASHVLGAGIEHPNIQCENVSLRHRGRGPNTKRSHGRAH